MLKQAQTEELNGKALHHERKIFRVNSLVNSKKYATVEVRQGDKKRTDEITGLVLWICD